MRLGFFFYGGMVVSQIRVLGEFSPYRTLQHKKAYHGRPFYFQFTVVIYIQIVLCSSYS